MLPQNSGFFTIEANEDLPWGDGGGAAAPALPLAAHSIAEGGLDSGALPLQRSRRSAGESTMPKVYGQVMWSISLIPLSLLFLNTEHHLSVPLAAPGKIRKHLCCFELASVRAS